MEEQIEQEIQLLMRLEDFCASPEFTESVQQYIQENSGIFYPVEEDIPIEFYLKFQEYTQLIEKLLEEFLNQNELTAEQLTNILRKIDGSDILTCLEYILATTEFENFLQMMCQYNDTNQWEVSEDIDNLFSELGVNFETNKKEQKATEEKSSKNEQSKQQSKVKENNRYSKN